MTSPSGPGGRGPWHGPAPNRKPWLTLVVAVAGVAGLIAVFVVVVVASFNWLRGDEIQSPSERATRVELAGAEETVFAWRTDRCADFDIPDLPSRTFTDARGRVQLISSSYPVRRFIGSDLRRLSHPCEVLMRSDANPDPSQFADREWIASTFTPDGRTVFALVHDEYQGYKHDGQCPSGDYFKCWYNAITLAISRDGGRTYRQAAPAPRHLVASVPYPYEPDAGPYGLFAPSNIVLNRDDGYYYAMMRATKYRDQAFGACLMRTKTLADPSSWRAWGGSEFDVRFVNPYTERDVQPSDHLCAPVSPNQIGAMVESLTYNEYLGKWLLVGSSQDETGGARLVGFFFSVSEDLKTWSKRKLITEVELPFSYQCGDPNPVGYPSVVDPGSRSRNFATSGRNPYLYFTRYHYRDCVQSLNRDLIRVPLRLSK